MKYIKYLSFLFSGLVIISCNKIEVDTPEFDVSINKTTFTLNDTAKFSLSGSPSNIVFYSGDVGNNYDTRNLLADTAGVPEMAFTTALTALTGSSTSTNLSLLVSNNFSGNYNQADILAATWTDITSRVIIPGTNSRVVLTPYLVKGKPLYVAFKFQTVDPTKTQRLVTISNFSFKTVFPTQTFQNSINVYDAGFASFDFAGTVGKWVIPITSTTNATFTHPAISTVTEADNDWAISRGFETNVIRPSTGIVLKNLSNEVVRDYNYVFTKRGTYKMVFIASNNTNKEYKEVIKEFNVTVN